MPSSQQSATARPHHQNPHSGGSKVTQAEINTLLKDEYFGIQKFVQSFDDKTVTIKAWSVTFSLASIVGAFASHASLVLVIAGLSSIAFWLTEIHIRAYQYAYFDRSGKIERYFKSKNSTLAPLQTGESWKTEFDAIGFKKLTEIAFWPETIWPHLFPVLLASILYPLAVYKVMQI